MKQLSIWFLLAATVSGFTGSLYGGQQSPAVSEFNKEEGFKMTPSSLSSMGISFSTLSSGNAWSVPKEAIVRVKHSTGVYRRYGGWISLVLVKTGGTERDTVRITSEDLQAGDEIAVHGTQFLRMTELDLNADTVDTCSH